MPLRVSFLHQLTTAPTGPAAIPHVAGWSENLWVASDIGLLDKIQRIIPLRCRLLPTQGAIVGYRTQSYTIIGNKLVPGGSASVKQLERGNSGYTCDIPQMCLSMTFAVQGGPNKAQYKMRGIPDGQVEGGEWSPTQAWGQGVQNWRNGLVTDAWCMLGRNLLNPSANVLSIIGNVLTVDVALPGVVANQTSIRLKKVKDNLGRPIKGTFLVTAIAGTAYTLAGYTHTANAGVSGTCRVDSLVVLPIAAIPLFVTGRITSKKVGRPFESYRGRASRKTPA